MASKQSKSIVLKNVEPLKPVGIKPEQQHNVRLFRATVTIGDRDFTVIVPLCFTDTASLTKATKGRPWSTQANLFQWRGKPGERRAGGAAIGNADGELAGYMLHVELAEYHPELDTRPKAEAKVVDTSSDEAPDLF